MDIVGGAEALKVSDVIAQFLVACGVDRAFVLSGGASLHLIDSVHRTEGIDFTCPLHEQAAAMAADGYARIKGFGAAITTSGPGATNLLTGTCCSYYDSVPAIMITGQVSTFRFKRDTGVRQMGFQETDVVEIFRPITKYAVCVTEAAKIRIELEKAYFMACDGRPGPVLVDIPDNLQRQKVVWNELESYQPPLRPTPDLQEPIDKIFSLIESSQRPVLIYGWGVRLSRAEEEFIQLAERLGWPLLPTWAVLDLIAHDHPRFVGNFGTHGLRHSNFTVQNCDLLVSIGCRIDTRASGSLDTFAREAKRVVVDVDPSELRKFETFEWPVDVSIQCDAKEFCRQFLERSQGRTFAPITSWLDQIQSWKELFPVVLPEHHQEELVNPYVLVEKMSRHLPEHSRIFLDTGCCLAWFCQGFHCKTGQRLIHDFNNTAMGYALPAAIGASYIPHQGPLVCITGDGSLLMNIQELATVKRHDIPLKIFVLNNRGHSMICQTQDQWLDSVYLASSVQGGLPDPDYSKIAEAFGIPSIRIESNGQLEERIQEALQRPGPVLCEVFVPPHHRVVPQMKYGRTLEDAEPLLEREVLSKQMLVPLHPSALQ